MHFDLAPQCPVTLNLNLASLKIGIFAGNKGTGFNSFKKHFLEKSIFELTLGDLTVKKRKIGKRNLYLIENRLNTNEMWCEADNKNYRYHICVKGYLDFNCNQAVLYKISNCNEIAINFTYSQKSYVLKDHWKMIDQLLLPYKCYVGDM